jgi:hypothetical protein
MKKGLLLIIMFVLLVSLSGCYLIRERILAPPDEMTVPDGSSQAVCTKGEVIYTFVYQLDGVYLYYIDGNLQGDAGLEHVQEEAFLHDESVINYLYEEYGESNCVITDYEDTE